MKSALLLFVLSFPTGLPAQERIPAGTILPLQLNTTVDERKSKPGQIITARIMQDVPLDRGMKIRAGAKVIGRITAVHARASQGSPALSVRFDELIIARRRISVTTDLRALASLMEVHDAQVPTNGPDRGTSENSWTTIQVGGDVVYRGGGPVVNGSGVVGWPAPGGVLDRVSARFGSQCRGELDDNDRPQALWVFSSDACGIYGFPGLVIVHAGRTEPMGEITLATAEQNLHVPAGSGLLLRVAGTTASESSGTARN